MTVSPTGGTLEVTTLTAGSELDLDGYSVRMDGEAPFAIGAAATLRRSDINAGNHTLTIGDLASNCTVSGDNPRTFSISPGEITAVTFSVTCAATTGSLQVTSGTTGPSPDPDGYTLSLDGVDRGSLATNAAVTLSELVPGSHIVGLGGVSGNCQVAEGNPRVAVVQAGQTTTVAFVVSCVVPPPNSGTLHITTATTGPDPDPNGYAFTVDNASKQTIGVNTAANVTDVAVGAHTVQLLEIAGNCTVQGTNPRSVTVSGGVTAVNFAVTCSATTGTLEIRTTTTGPNPDPDGYTVSVDGQTGQAIPINGNLSVPDVAAGTHTLRLGGLATNCRVMGDNPVSVTLVAGGNTPTAFSVSCPTPIVAHWTRMASGTTRALYFVSGSSGSNVFVVAGATNAAPFGSATLHYDGRSWLTQRVETELGVNGVWANSEAEAFAAGWDIIPDLGAFLHYDGRIWSRMDPPPWDAPPGEREVFPNAVWGSSGTDVFAVGEMWFGGSSAFIAHYNGSAWSRMDFSGGGGTILRHVWGSSGTDVYAAGGWNPGGGDAEPFELRTVILHYDGHEWLEVLREPNLTLGAIWGSSASDVYSVGAEVSEAGLPIRGAIWHFDGSHWSGLPSPSAEPLRAIWGSSAQNIYVLAETGAIWHFDAANWSPVSPPPGRVFDIWGSSETDVFAVGEGGGIFHGTP